MNIAGLIGSNSRNRAILMLLVTAVLWSTSGLLIKLVDWNPMAIAGTRSAVAALLIILLMRRSLRFTWSPAQIGGAMAYAATVIAFVVAVKHTTSANAILLQYTSPVFTALLGAWFLKERVSRFDWGIIGLVMTGMILFFLDNLAFGYFWGNIAGIFSGVTISILFLCMRSQKDGSPAETILLGNLLTALVGIPFMLQSTPTDAAPWACLVFLGIFQLGLPFLLYSIAIKSVTALDSVLILAIEPLLNPIWVFLVIGEVPGKWALIGGSVVLISITARNLVTSLRIAPKKVAGPYP